MIEFLYFARGIAIHRPIFGQKDPESIEVLQHLIRDLLGSAAIDGEIYGV